MPDILQKRKEELVKQFNSLEEQIKKSRANLDLLITAREQIRGKLTMIREIEELGGRERKKK